MTDEWDPRDGAPESISLLESMISLVVEPLRMPTTEALKGMTPDQRLEVAAWCGDMHLAASDNPVTPGPIPEFLDDALAYRWKDPLPNIPTDIWGQPIDD